MLYFIKNNKSIFGHLDNQRSVVFGFKNHKTASIVRDHIRYIPSLNKVEEISHNRYIINTHYNMENNISTSPEMSRELDIVTCNRYNASVICCMNNVYVRVIDDICEREDGDIELLSRVPIHVSIPLTEDTIRLNLEMLFIV